MLSFTTRVMTSKNKGLSLKSYEFKDSESEDTASMFDMLKGRMREKIVLQQLIVIARLSPHLADKTEIEAHYERLKLQLGKQYIMDNMTGLLLIYPSCVLHIIESSREVLLSVLRDLKEMQQQEGALLVDPKVVFMDHHPESRLFLQWSHKLLSSQHVRDSGIQKLEEEEEATETLVVTILSVLQKLGKQMETSQKNVPGLVLDETPELVIPQKVLDKLFTREELLTSQQYLQMYDSPLHINMDFGQVSRSSCLTTV